MDDLDEIQPSTASSSIHHHVHATYDAQSMKYSFSSGNDSSYHISGSEEEDADPSFKTHSRHGHSQCNPSKTQYTSFKKKRRRYHVQ